MTVAPFLLAGAMKPVLNDIRRRGYEFDIIDAHYFYPDGVAAVMLAQHLRKPVLVTARGSDINWFPKYRLPRRMIRWTALNASGIISVCQALKDALVTLGVPEHKIVVLRNGVDLQLFYPIDRKDERQRMQLRNTTLLSVGQLIERKGHDIVIKALVHLPQAELLIAGEGEEERSLKALAHSLCVEKRVRFLGAVRHEELRNYYGAADILVLASSREGWPNVILEALACGTPAVATKVWGTPEVIRSPDAGMLIEERSPVALARAVCTLLANYPDRSSTRRYAEQFSWEETTRGQITLFRKILQGPRASV
jgi:glycosyltransferase involved in cell wall biosynthesis